MTLPPPPPPMPQWFDAATQRERATLKGISGDLRVVGIVLAILGLIVCGGATSTRGAAVLQHVLLAAGLLVLLLPGVWFVFAASLVSGGRGGMIVAWSLRVAALQGVTALVMGAIALNGVLQGRRLFDEGLFVPVMLLIFFVPAQVAALVQLIRARGLIAAREARRGFAMTAVAAPATLVAMPEAAGDAELPVAIATPVDASRDP